MSDTEDLVKRQYGANAQRYVTSSVQAKGASLQRLVDLVQPQKHWRVLDVSTGGGHTARAFAPFVREVIATDLTPEMLAAAEKFIRAQGVTNIEFKIADAENLPFADQEFDLVTNRIALHHYSDAPKAIHEMARVLRRPEPGDGKQGGVLGFTDNTVPPDKQTAGAINHFEKLRDPSHNWCYPVVRLEKYFADAGLKVEHIEESPKTLDFEDWADRMGCTHETKTELKRLLDTAPPQVREFFNPRMENSRFMFSIREAILIARKQ
ncbi:MAG: methyltransferase domain-containing protein [Chloroflexi bacterium]|nr:methyltransferase domain-containing protein [Chloroflexota bacterium]